MASSLRQFGFKKMSFRKRLVSTKDIFIEADPVQVKEIFSNTVISYFDEIFELERQNKNLSKTRDLLIPQLVTGRRELKQ